MNRDDLRIVAISAGAVFRLLPILLDQEGSPLRGMRAALLTIGSGVRKWGQ
jgi:hypothetical protein